MATVFSVVKRKYKQIFRYLFILAAIFAIVFAIPKHGKFKYEFERGKPWLHEDLFAPFSFPIEKAPEEIRIERQQVQENFKPFYLRHTDLPELKMQQFITELQQELQDEPANVQVRQERLIKRGMDLLQEVYNTGIIEVAEPHQAFPPDALIQVMRNRVVTHRRIGELLTLKEAHNMLLQQVQEDTLFNKPYFVTPLFNALAANVEYDEELSERRLAELLSKISLTRSLVQENEKIISKGNIITPEEYQVLMSLKKEYEQRVSKRGNTEILIGYLILISLIFLLYIVYIRLFEPEVLKTNRNVILTLVNIVIFILLSIYVVGNPTLDIYLVPYCVLPITVLAFYGSRAAFLSMVVVVLIAGLIAPNAFEFVLIQLLAGLTAVLSMLHIRYISQFFISTILIFLTYVVAYFAMNFIQGVELEEMPWTNFLWFGGNFILTLLAYPLIYAYEKLFGLMSEITLIELGDINRKLLKKLGNKAPGTFQHSLQVSNLAETLVSEIGGDPLLTRVGALYHDIGKMDNPTYFIENQKFSKNPHDYLDEEESASIIIRHVTKGEEMARSLGLPEPVIDFIRMHHGTSRVEFFYQNYLKKHAEAATDDTAFRYPGPRPRTKEQAVVMIVDSVEAASRSLKQVEEGTIEKLVDKIIDTKINDHQLEDAALTLQEISYIRMRLKKLLRTLYHVRVEYPDAEKPAEKPEEEEK